jgi:cellulose synthase/poly-beta-1,6-N-acetylglucosamine synthase-like glycosyltransferase
MISRDRGQPLVAGYSLLSLEAPRTWLVIPARNEAERIEATLRRYLSALGSADRVVVVVNGSTDGTARIVHRIALDDGRVVVVVEPRPVGKGGAILSGLAIVKEKAQPKDVACYADADGELDIRDLLRLSAAVSPGELVTGSRWLDVSLQHRRPPIARRVASRAWNRLVHGVLRLDVTDSSAAKAMRVGDIDRLTRHVTETGFAFDIDLVMAAQRTGMDVFEMAIPSTYVPGGGRVHRAVPSMLSDLAGLRRKYRRDLAPTDEEATRPGTPMIDHPIANPVLSGRQKIFFLALLATVTLGLIRAPLATLVVINVVLVAFYLAANSVKLLLIYRALESTRELAAGPDELARLVRDSLPVYTILVPVYRESAAVLSQVVAGIHRLDYPREKLDVKILLEADDIETREAAQALSLADEFHVLTVPDVGPRGKPRACNFGLEHARGEYIVIYDAEDRPEPDQLLKSVWAYRHSAPNVVCLQAKLNYFNREQNLLTRWFTTEYSTWFDLLLPGLYSLDVAIPLGGTSNHFITQRLREIGAWDAYNVTEDADLGMRIEYAGYKTGMIDSTTYEEANSRVYNWIRQRSRWTKGYLQTYLVHMRHPVRLYQKFGFKAFTMFQLFIGGNVLSALINPVYWLLTALWFATHLRLIQQAFPAPVMYAGVMGLLVGNFVFVFASIGGCVRRRNFEDVKWAVFTPLYWLLMSVAAWKGFLQLFYRPFYWEKTIHGHYLYREGAGEPAIPTARVTYPEHGGASPLLGDPAMGAVPQPRWEPPNG